MRFRTVLLTALGAAAVVALVVVSRYRVPTTFNISATTQSLEIVIGPSHRSRWTFGDATVYLGYESDGRKFSGSVLAMQGARVWFERIGAGALRIRLKARSAGEAVARLYDPEEAPRMLVKDRLVVVSRVSAGGAARDRPTVLPMSGAVSFGTEVGEGFADHPTLLLRGNVTLLAHTLLGEERYDAGRVTLDIGDFLRVEQQGDAYGLLIARDEPEMSAVFRVIGRSARVHRFGAAGYEVYASPLTRITNDHALQAIWGATLFVFALMVKWIGIAKPRENR